MGVERGQVARRSASAATPLPDLTQSLPAAARVHWLRVYARDLVLLDGGLLALSAATALAVRFGSTDEQVAGVPYVGVSVVICLGWLASLALGRCYEARFVAEGNDEFKRVVSASIRFGGILATVAFAFQIAVARGFLGVLLPVGVAFLLLGRYGARLVLQQRRRRGECNHRVVVAGTAQQVVPLIEEMRKDEVSGLQVVGVCVPGVQSELVLRDGTRLPVLGGLTTIVETLAAVQADTVAIAPGEALSGDALRRLSYELEGTGIDLLVAPALTNVTGTRISVRPIAGLPLMHVDEPELSGARKLIKALFDRSGAALGLVLLAPVLLALGLAIRLTSPGPALFKQERIGRHGETFKIWKLRTMHVDAEKRLHEIAHLNEHDGVLFKMTGDPRITPLGRKLRSLSLDELPQLVNVLLGHMSIVGPRPPLASEVQRYEGHTVRRLMVKPGITGLWQVSGRSNLSWDESVRLDLHYVENWSLALDLSVLAKTVVAVVKRRGAY